MNDKYCKRLGEEIDGSGLVPPSLWWKVRCGVLFALALGTALGAPIHYGVINLGVLPGGERSSGFGINEAGQVAGTSGTFAGERAFLTRPGWAYRTWACCQAARRALVRPLTTSAK